jgi:hypothetical protein
LPFATSRTGERPSASCGSEKPSLRMCSGLQASAVSRSIYATATGTGARPSISAFTACRPRRRTRVTPHGSTASIRMTASARSGNSRTPSRAMRSATNPSTDRAAVRRAGALGSRPPPRSSADASGGLAPHRRSSR